MVKKLIKHELIYYSKSLLLAEAIIIGFGLLNRIIQIFENDTDVYASLFTSSLVTLIIGCVLCPFLALILSIVRFYRNFYTAEGYLTFTLPATVNQHLIAKILSAFIAQVSAFLAVILAASAASFGDLLNEVIKAIAYVLKKAYISIGGNLFAYIAEVIILICISCVVNMLLYFCCISLGQLSKKNRILAAVLIYFGYNVASQFIASFISLGAGIAMQNMDFTWFTLLMEEHPHQTVHGIIVIFILLSAIFGAIFYFIIHRVTSKRLNLE